MLSTQAPGAVAVEGNEPWRMSAACVGVDPDLFFPIGPAGDAAVEIERAKAVCASCPVCSQCLLFALETNQDFGVWGGRDEHERRALRRQRRSSRLRTISPE